MLNHVEPRDGRTMQNYILVPTLVEWAVFLFVGQLSKSIWTWASPKSRLQSATAFVETGGVGGPNLPGKLEQFQL